MTLALLPLVQQAADELGLTSPRLSAVITATDDQTRQMLALLRRVGDDMQRMGYWVPLQTEWTVPIVAPVVTTGNTVAGSPVVNAVGSVAGVVGGAWAASGATLTPTARVLSVSPGQIVLTEPATATGNAVALTLSQDTYLLPADYGSLIERTAWDRGRRWELQGPLSPQEDEWLRSGVVAAGPRRKFRPMGRTPAIVFRPPPTAADTGMVQVFEYISRWWVTDSAGTPKAAYTADTDLSSFPDDLMVMGLKWQFWRAKGMEYGELRADWDRQVRTAMAQQGEGKTLNMAGPSWPHYVGVGNVPDGYFGGAQ